MKWVILILAVLTAVFLIVSFVQDIKERTVFSFPCLILTDAWAIVLWSTVSYTKAEIICFLLAHSSIYLLLRLFKIWGDGDSDVFLLFGNVCMVFVKAGSILSLAISECLLLAGAVSLSLFIGAVEYKLRKRKFSLKGDMAVIPGFSLVMIAVMISGYAGRFM